MSVVWREWLGHFVSIRCSARRTAEHHTGDQLPRFGSQFLFAVARDVQRNSMT